MPGSLTSISVDGFADHFVGRVEALQPLAGELPVLGVLELDVGRRREFCGGLGHLAESSWSCPTACA